MANNTISHDLSYLPCCPLLTDISPKIEVRFWSSGGPSLRETPVPEEVHPPLTLRAENEI